MASWAIDLSVGNPSVSFCVTKETWFYKGLELCINRLTDDEAAAKLLPIGAPGKCEGWEVGCLIDPGSEGDGEGILLLSVVLDVWPALKVDYLEFELQRLLRRNYH